MSEPRTWHDENVLHAALSAINADIGRYILRALDADAGRKEPTPPSDERDLGRRLRLLGDALTRRADERDAATGHPVLEGGAP